jgi:N-acylneuraminate cytidylyltransferase
MIRHPRAHSLRSVSGPEQTPYKMWRMKGEHLQPLLQISGVAEPHSLARQQLPDVYWQNGYVDIVRSHVVLELGMMAGHRVVPFIIDEPVPGFDYEEEFSPLEEALSALARGEWPRAARARGTRHAV